MAEKIPKIGKKTAWDKHCARNKRESTETVRNGEKYKV